MTNKSTENNISNINNGATVMSCTIMFEESDNSVLNKILIKLELGATIYVAQERLASVVRQTEFTCIQPAYLNVSNAA
eukprot:5929802-Amphidinium_carterae.1